MRLDEVEELAARRPDLLTLGVSDVMIREVMDEVGSLGWTSIVVFFREGGPWWSTPVTWRLPLRPTYLAARSAVTALLEGLLDGQARAQDEHPPIRPKRAVAELEEIVQALLMDEWRDRRRPEPKPRGRAGSRPPRPHLPAGVPWPVKEWGLAVKTTRENWDWTQQQLAEKVGLDRTRISKVERGIWLAPDDLIGQLCEVLDLNPPEVQRHG